MLGLDALPFVCVPRLSSVFASVVEQAGLSGTNSYRMLVDPLTTAAIHLSQALHERDCEHLHPAMILLVAVVDAPMVVVTEPGKEDEPVLTPWVRVRRDRVIGSEDPEFGIDVVHADFFHTFVSTVLPPFSIMFGERILERRSAFSTGMVSAEEAGMWQLPESDAMSNPDSTDPAPRLGESDKDDRSEDNSNDVDPLAAVWQAVAAEGGSVLSELELSEPSDAGADAESSEARADDSGSEQPAPDNEPAEAGTDGSGEGSESKADGSRSSAVLPHDGEAAPGLKGLSNFRR
jgi:hypothetical protein